MDQKLSLLRKKAMRLPLLPGVYLMKDKNKKIIYIGKAKALKNRVSQYFGSQKNHGKKVRSMVEQVEDFDYIVTDSEFEALILECSLIKQHSPKYNILLKDDKGYHYIKITNEPYPRILKAFQIEKDGAQYIGPYASGYIVGQTVDELLKMFKIPSCNKNFEAEKGKSRPCLNFHIGNCSAPCASKISHKDYLEAVHDAIEFIHSGALESIKNLTRRMEDAAEKLEFEKAARIRDRINAIKKIKERQKVVFATVKDQDVIASARSGEKICIEVFRFSNSRLYDNQHFIFDKAEDTKSTISAFILQYYDHITGIPKRIALEEKPDDSDLLSRWLSEKAEKKVELYVPQKGEQKKLINMCENNAAEHLMQSEARPLRQNKAVEELSALLNLKTVPKRIEAYDISNTAGSDNVGVMVVYKDGVPSRKDYRRFKIKSFSGQDDYRSLKEVIERRFRHYFEEKDSKAAFGELPGLILIDGGAGQLSAVTSVLKETGLLVPAFGMVKDDKHRTRAIASQDGEIAISKTRQAFTLLTSIQNEVHRFAIEYHRKRRKASGLSSKLLSIEGVGQNRANILLSHFKSISKIEKASVEELAAVKGIDQNTAKNIHNYFKFLSE